MKVEEFQPTPEQERVIGHDGCAFTSACPGAGKTRILVERARRLLKGPRSGHTLALLSFTNAAVNELKQRLRIQGIMASPEFPHYLGTLDSFIWQFLVAPFGVAGCDQPPRLIPDLGELPVKLPNTSRRLPLRCFDRSTGLIIPELARECGFDSSQNASFTRALETRARNLRGSLRLRGQIDFADARAIALDRITSEETSATLAKALSSRFSEVVVDEAQDCNPVDIEILKWLREAGIVTKIVCDPHQAIYEFRGGVTDEIITLGKTFPPNQHIPITGNFRSTGAICNAIVALRPPDARSVRDRPVGSNRNDPTPLYILSYASSSIPSAIGDIFCELLRSRGLPASKSPVLAATRASALKAVGQYNAPSRQTLTTRLAAAVTGFHTNFDTQNRQRMLESVHEIVLRLENVLKDGSYHHCVAAMNIEPHSWRPRILKLIRELHHDADLYPDPDDWHAKAKSLLDPYVPSGGRSISQLLPRNSDLGAILRAGAASALPTRPMTIHSVKGQEFPAVCVVMTTATTRGILDFLADGEPQAYAEESRKIYVAASRARSLLVIAVPKGQAQRFARHLGSTGTQVSMIEF